LKLALTFLASARHALGVTPIRPCDWHCAIPLQRAMTLLPLPFELAAGTKLSRFCAVRACRHSQSALKLALSFFASARHELAAAPHSHRCNLHQASFSLLRQRQPSPARAFGASGEWFCYAFIHL
jgi:hypothetical protein